jgi:hypothetical protein
MIFCKHYVVLTALFLLPLTLFASRVCCWIPGEGAQWVLCQSDGALPSQACPKVRGAAHSQSGCQNDYKGGNFQDC